MFHDLFTPETLQLWVEQNLLWGLLLGFFLPFAEAFLPVLPIVVFAVVNANAFGLPIGFLLTWSGAVLGAYAVFMVIRRYGQSRFVKKLNRHPYVKKMMWRINEQGVIPLFVLLCFPFTPSFLINIVGALSNIKQSHYLLATVTGKAVMLLLMSYIGSDIRSFITQPLKSVVAILILAALWFIGKKVEEYYHAHGGRK